MQIIKKVKAQSEASKDEIDKISSKLVRNVLHSALDESGHNNFSIDDDWEDTGWTNAVIWERVSWDKIPDDRAGFSNTHQRDLTLPKVEEVNNFNEKELSIMKNLKILD